MTDDQMDARLRRAGEAWRAAPPATDVFEPEAETVELAVPHQRRKLPRPGLLLSAAAVAAALVAGAAVVLTNVSGSNHRSADVSGFAGPVWLLDGRPGVTSSATVVFNPDGTFVADDSCMVFGGSYQLDHGMVFAEPHDLRDKQCTDSAGEVTFGDKGLTTLTGGAAYTLDGSALTLGSGSDVLHLHAARDLPRPTLDIPTAVGATWVLVGAQSSDGQPVPVRGAPTFVIKNNELRASDGCNVLSGQVDVIGNKLDTTKGGGLHSTEISCADASNATIVVDAMLGNSLTMSVRGATMTVTDGTGAKLTYQWRPDDAEGTNPTLLESRNWRVTAFDGKPALPGVTLSIAGDGSYRINDGCIEQTGKATVRAGAIAFHRTGTSDGTPNCDTSPQGEQATSFDSFVDSDAALWAIRDGRLLLFSGGAQADAFVLTPNAPVVQVATPDTIENTPWALSQISTEGSNSSSGSGSSDTGVVLTVRAATFTLETKCHSYSGTASHTATTVDFSDVQDLGGVNCHDEFTDAAAHVVQGGSATWDITAGELEIVQGKTTLTFDR